MQVWRTSPESARSTGGKRSLAAFLLAFCACGAVAYAAGESDAAWSGDHVPILFNDHTVRAKPDLLTRSRVLLAIVKHGQVYVPARSMFEQMGASVAVSADGKTITATKSDVRVSLTLGRGEVLVNGEARPLDVPPMLYHGSLLIPLRVLSEALGAYVQWVPQQHLVVVRYLPSPVAPPITPPPITPIPPIIPPGTPVVTPPPTAPPVQRPYGFVQAAFAAPKNYNEFAVGQYCPESYLVSGAFAPRNSKFAVKVDFRQDVYVTSDNLTDAIDNHYTAFSTIDGGTALTSVFLARQSTLDARLEFAVAAPRVYLGVGYLHTSNNYGYPQLNAVGGGIEKLPDLRSGISFFGSAFYYPAASGNYTVTNAASVDAGRTYRQQYDILKYDIGLAFVPGRSPLYLYGGLIGDRYYAKQNAPINQIHDGPYLGLGLKL